MNHTDQQHMFLMKITKTDAYFFFVYIHTREVYMHELNTTYEKLLSI